MSINHLATTVDKYDSLLGKFPIEYRTKLRLYTSEELFYVYRCLTFEVKYNRNGDITDLFILTLKNKIYAWLREEPQGTNLKAHPVYPSAWDKLGYRWRKAYEQWYVLPLPKPIKVKVDYTPRAYRKAS